MVCDFAQIQDLEAKQAALLEMKTNAEEQLKEAEGKVCGSDHRNFVFCYVVSILDNCRVLSYRSNHYQRPMAMEQPTRQVVAVHYFIVNTDRLIGRWIAFGSVCVPVCCVGAARCACDVRETCRDDGPDFTIS